MPRKSKSEKSKSKKDSGADKGQGSGGGSPIKVNDQGSGKAPGKRCPTCTAAGRETWVFAGRSCPIDATYVP
ncbi:hypothetical protein HD806DRAFT_533240 [Xylariaceae sp. AK1471]|nr:hypothetical protein HD806DRAFT_533240 [Xylariaceae sp. AK1471]